MGKEAEVAARFGLESDAGRLQLEPPRLIFRGAVRRVWQGEALAGARAEADDLVLADGTRFTLGPGKAARWAEAIANPKGRLDKLGVKPGLRVAISNFEDLDFIAELSTRIALQPPDGTSLDLVFHSADTEAALADVAQVLPRLAPGGAVWVVFLKGAAAGVRDVNVFAALRALGLVDTKVCAFSQSRTALRFSRRVQRIRPKAGSV